MATTEIVFRDGREREVLNNYLEAVRRGEESASVNTVDVPEGVLPEVVESGRTEE